MTPDLQIGALIETLDKRDSTDRDSVTVSCKPSAKVQFCDNVLTPKAISSWWGRVMDA
jgi:hypothetical protein